jgi:tRNA (guanine-N7-)-methyltransferase
LVEKNQLPVQLCTEDLYAEVSEHSEYSEAASIQTYYESMWLARGLNIRYMKFRLPHTGDLEEPDIEIELDDYRSYHRTKRSSLDARK